MKRKPFVLWLEWKIWKWSAHALNVKKKRENKFLDIWDMYDVTMNRLIGYLLIQNINILISAMKRWFRFGFEQIKDFARSWQNIFVLQDLSKSQTKQISPYHSEFYHSEEKASRIKKKQSTNQHIVKRMNRCRAVTLHRIFDIEYTLYIHRIVPCIVSRLFHPVLFRLFSKYESRTATSQQSLDMNIQNKIK